MAKLSKFGEDFLLLALRIDKHIKGYIDFYISPKKLRQIVDHESLTAPNTLLNDSNYLLKQLGAQGFDKERERYIEKLLIAMKTSIEILNGSEISIKDQFTKLYDVDLRPAKEVELDNLKEEFNKAYEGSGSLEERMKKLRVRRKVPKSDVFVLFKKALKIVKNRTEELFANLLPKNEHIIIDLIGKKNDNKAKWSYYNWYLGNFTSRIEINPNYNVYWSSLLSSAAHEGYPGHHTEFAVKEQCLYKKLYQFEHSLLILHSPKLIISEGIGNLAISVMFSDSDAAEISLREFCPDTSKTDSIDVIASQNKVRRKLALFWYNLAYRALIDEYSAEELIRYGKNFEIFNEDTIQNNLKRMSDPVYSKNAFLYDLGTNLIRNKYGIIPSVKNFQNLLKNAILPSNLK